MQVRQSRGLLTLRGQDELVSCARHGVTFAGRRRAGVTEVACLRRAGGTGARPAAL